MAEIALVASIFGVASFGTKVATTLYEAADIMIHAHQQIASMAKHITQFTAILRHLGRVLEAEKGSCSNNLLREIRKIKRSCKTTFREIQMTIKSKIYRPFVPVRWLFKNSKAKELEARLDSEQSMLQVMIHTVTVSKLGDMHSKSKEDSKQISGLREEINILKTLIIENYNNVTELRRAEQRAEAEALRSSPSEPGLRQAPPEFQDDQTIHPPSLIGVQPGEVPYKRSGVPASSSSDSDVGDSDPDTTAGKPVRTESPYQAGGEKAQSSNQALPTAKLNPPSTIQPASSFNRTQKPVQDRASTLLLQMIPYRPRSSVKAHGKEPSLLIGGPSERTNSSSADAKPVMEEVTSSVRLLLDKWTTAGSAPVSDVLVENASEKNQNGKFPRKNAQSPPSFLGSQPPQRWMDGFSDDELDGRSYTLPGDRYPHVHDSARRERRRWPVPPLSARTPSFEVSNVPITPVWKGGNAFFQTQSNHISQAILESLRLANGGILYMKRSELQYAFYLDDLEIHGFDLVPYSLIEPEESKILATEIGKGWVRQEALDLLGYSYTETKDGCFSILRNLFFSEIEELVRLSFQGLCRNMEERSRQIIEERDWQIDVQRHEIPPFRAPERRHPRRRARPRDEGVPSDYIYNDEHWPDSGNDGGLESDVELQPSRAGIANPPAKDKEQKPRTAEVRFTLPRLASTQRIPETPIPIRPVPQKAETEAGRKEIQEAETKLKLLMKRRDDAAKANDHDVKADLEYYAIPDMQARIQALREAQDNGGNGPSVGKQGAPPQPTAVETDSESSEESGS